MKLSLACFLFQIAVGVFSIVHAVDVECNGGTICQCNDVSDGLCRLICKGNRCDHKTLRCSDGYPCIMECSSSASCKNADFYCGGATECTVQCVSNETCGNKPDVYCEDTDRCSIECLGTNSCSGMDIDCSSSECLLQCNPNSEGCAGVEVYATASIKSYLCTGEQCSNVNDADLALDYAGNVPDRSATWTYILLSVGLVVLLCGICGSVYCVRRRVRKSHQNVARKRNVQPKKQSMSLDIDIAEAEGELVNGGRTNGNDTTTQTNAKLDGANVALNENEGDVLATSRERPQDIVELSDSHTSDNELYEEIRKQPTTDGPLSKQEPEENESNTETCSRQTHQSKQSLMQWLADE